MCMSEAVRKPVGMQQVIGFIENVCREAAMYRCIGAKPAHLLVALDPGEGRSTLVEYMVRMYKAHGVLPFTCGLDDYLEVVLDGTLPQLRRTFMQIGACAVYANHYENVVAMDVTAIAAHLNESQFTEFMERCSRLCEHACVVFFTSAQRSRNEERMVQKLVEGIPDICEIAVEPYKTDELTTMMQEHLEMLNIRVEDREGMCSLLRQMAEQLEPQCARAAVEGVRRMMRYVDFTAMPACLSREDIALIRADWQKKKGA